jgi:DNA-binding SARP family transcriptional activator
LAYCAIRLLGEQEIRHSDLGKIEIPDVGWDVLGNIVLSPQLYCSRDKLVARIWPDQDDEAGRHCLASALWRIRSKFPKGRDPMALSADGVSLRTSDPIWIDVIAFERRANRYVHDPDRLRDPTARAKLRRALTLYRGDFLPEWDEECLAIERARLRALYLDATYELAMAEARQGDWARARSAAQVLCAAEPLREDAQRLLIEAHFRCGNRGLALRQYDLCARILRDELAVAPMAETTEMITSIRDKVLGGTRDKPRPEVLNELSRTQVPMTYRATLTATRDHLRDALAVIDQTLSQ